MLVQYYGHVFMLTSYSAVYMCGITVMPFCLRPLFHFIHVHNICTCRHVHPCKSPIPMTCAHTHTHTHTGAFIIPYLVMLFLLGIPLFYLELLLGQGIKKGPVLVWHKFLPNFTGVGIASVFVIVYISLYYNVIIAWVIFYFFNSFRDPLPWAQCLGHNIQSCGNDNITSNFSDSRILLWQRCCNESTE